MSWISVSRAWRRPRSRLFSPPLDVLRDLLAPKPRWSNGDRSTTGTRRCGSVSPGWKLPESCSFATTKLSHGFAADLRALNGGRRTHTRIQSDRSSLITNPRVPARERNTGHRSLSPTEARLILRPAKTQLLGDPPPLAAAWCPPSVLPPGLRPLLRAGRFSIRLLALWSDHRLVYKTLSLFTRQRHVGSGVFVCLSNALV